MLLNAPQIYSDYLTPFTGVLVGEIMSFALTTNTVNLNFSYDPYFADAAVGAFPLSQKASPPIEILQVTP